MVQNMASAQPTELDGLRAVPNALDRATALAAYINRGEQQLRLAREARSTAVQELREQGTTWPEIVTATGISESYLRREAKR
jgi:hypothetical protein